MNRTSALAAALIGLVYGDAYTRANFDVPASPYRSRRPSGAAAAKRQSKKRRNVRARGAK